MIDAASQQIEDMRTRLATMRREMDSMIVTGSGFSGSGANGIQFDPSELAFHTGPQGLDGATGANGAQGAQGPGRTGPTGPSGPNGVITGPASTVTGPQGVPGASLQGPQGPAGGKEAIVPTNIGPRALFCTEAPQVWFFDAMRAEFPAASLPIDRAFLEVVERASLCVVAVSPEVPVEIGAAICGDVVTLRTLGALGTRCAVDVMIAGIRKGFANQRFPARSEEAMHLNNHRWRHMAGE